MSRFLTQIMNEGPGKKAVLPKNELPETDDSPPSPAPLEPVEKSYHASNSMLESYHASKLESYHDSKLESEQPSKLAPQKLNPKIEKTAQRSQLNIRVTTQRLTKLKMWALLNHKSIQEATELAIDSLLANYNDSSLATIDIDIDDMNDETIIFYRKHSGNKWTAKDNDSYKEVRNLRPDVIKIGILMSIIRAKTKINSFRYCIGAIQEAAETGLSETQEYLKYLEKQLKRK